MVIIHRHYDCLENLKSSIKKLLELIHEFIKVSGYKVNKEINYNPYSSTEQFQNKIF